MRKDLFLANTDKKSHYDLTYPGDFPIYEAFVEQTNKVPSIFHFKNDFTVGVIEKIIELGFKMVASVTYERFETCKTIYYNSVVQEFLEVVEKKNQKEEKICDIKIIFDLSNERYLINGKKIFEKHVFREYEIKEDDEVGSIHLIVKTQDGLELQRFDLDQKELDIRDNYGESFIKVHDEIVERLNTKNDKGIVLLYGDPGSGKTTFLRYLTTKIKDKNLIFVPPALSECISDPEMIPFLMRHRNSILIIEDGEKVISDRNSGNTSSTGVSNILNLTDGILGDCLNIQIIVTFNMSKEKIDTALLRKGRLIAEHKFGPLSLEDTNNLLKKLGKNFVSDKGLLVSDIYNIEKEEYKTEVKKIGFN